MPSSDRRLLAALQEKNILTQDQHTALEAALGTGVVLSQALKDAQIAETDWGPVLAEMFSMDFVDLTGRTIPQPVLDRVPQDVATNYQLVPFEFSNDTNTLHVAMVDPSDFKAIEAVEFLARKNSWRLKYHVIGPDNFLATVKQYESLGAEAEEVLSTIEDKYKEEQAVKKAKEDDKKQSLDDLIKSAPVSKMVEVIFKHAVEAKASDIHIEPLDEHSVVRYRIDGRLHISLQLPKHLHASVVSRIKVMANLKIDETRIPQDGRIRVNVEGMIVDLRISTLPLSQTEKVVIRILDTSGGGLTFEQLGFEGKNLKYVQDNIKKANGMFLVTGPTGSGKSTTLYSALNIINQEEVNVITLEDPIEYYLEGVNQSQVNAEIGYTFASGLRSILRQDPDIVMVGEIRDNETAELAIHAALTGHMVLSTLHTNDAIGAVPRFIDMHVEPFLLASTLNIVMAQRLVRKICTHCVEQIKLPERVLKIAQDIIAEIPEEAVPDGVNTKEMTFFKGKGCPRCGDSGYKGRLAVVECLVMTPSLQQVITANKMNEIVNEFTKQKSPTMRQDGVLKALRGMTTMEEVLTATK